MDRRFPIQEFDPERFSPFFGDQALSYQLLAGGACNSNYLVQTPSGERYVCRMQQRGDPAREQIAIRLAKDYVPCCEYLWVGESVSVQPYIEGQQFEPSTKLMQDAGRLIGQLAKRRFEQSGELHPDGSIRPFEGWPSFEEGLFGLLARPVVQAYLNKGQIIGLEQLLNTRSSIFADFDRCHNLVHGDFRPDNLLVKDNSIVAVLDWEFTHSGCSYMDMGNLLRHVSDKWKLPFKQGLEDSGFDLPDDWRFRAALIDLSSHLEFLASNRSDAFKQNCVDKIQSLLDLN